MRQLPSGRTRQWASKSNDGMPTEIAVISDSSVNGDEVLDTFIQVTTPTNVLISPSRPDAGNPAA